MSYLTHQHDIYVIHKWYNNVLLFNLFVRLAGVLFEAGMWVLVSVYVEYSTCLCSRSKASQDQKTDYQARLSSYQKPDYQDQKPDYTIIGVPALLYHKVPSTLKL